MEWNPPGAWDRMADFLRGRAATLPCKPRAIVMVSAHWLEPVFSVTSGARPQLIYDYYGFPPHTYELKYPAPGRRNSPRASPGCWARRRCPFSRIRAGASTTACSFRCC